MFDEKSMFEWVNSLEGKEKEFVRRYLRYVATHDETKSFMNALIDARKAIILSKAISIIGYGELKTPNQVLKELRGS